MKRPSPPPPLVGTCLWASVDGDASSVSKLPSVGPWGRLGLRIPSNVSVGWWEWGGVPLRQQFPIHTALSCTIGPSSGL